MISFQLKNYKPLNRDFYLLVGLCGLMDEKHPYPCMDFIIYFESEEYSDLDRVRLFNAICVMAPDHLLEDFIDLTRRNWLKIENSFTPGSQEYLELLLSSVTNIHFPQKIVVNDKVLEKEVFLEFLNSLSSDEEIENMLRSISFLSHQISYFVADEVLFERPDLLKRLITQSESYTKF